MTPEPARSSARGRLDWDGVREYWEHHHEVRARTDFDLDPHALGNVCTPEAPVWLNRHYAQAQEAVFDQLLAMVGRAPGRALDVGCGAGRWSERLHASGWHVTGIDLQQALIDHNRERLPHIAFERIALQSLQPDCLFELVCSVTVLGHVPHEEQPRAIERLRAITTPGAHVLLLENIRDQSAHVFANSVNGWTALLADQGFSRVAAAPYDYNPMLRALGRARRVAGAALRDALATVGRTSEAPTQGAAEGIAGGSRGAVQRAYDVATRVAGIADSRLDPRLTRRGSRIPPPVHSGMLFVRE